MADAGDSLSEGRKKHLWALGPFEDFPRSLCREARGQTAPFEFNVKWKIYLSDLSTRGEECRAQDSGSQLSRRCVA